MPERESDSNAATEPESGALAPIEPALPACADTQPETRLAAQRDAGAGTGARGLSITQIESNAASAPSTVGNQFQPHKCEVTAAIERPLQAPAHMLGQTDPASIGRYRVTAILGQGGFGRVYLAHDAVLDRNVAIKVPLPVEMSSYVDVESYL